jgi:type II secretory pathway pseudopilin PulG
MKSRLMISISSLALAAAMSAFAGDSAVTGIVSFHDLAHRVLKRAQQEFRKGLQAQDRGDDETAVRSFQNAIAIDPEFFAALNIVNVSNNWGFTLGLGVNRVSAQAASMHV